MPVISATPVSATPISASPISARAVGAAAQTLREQVIAALSDYSSAALYDFSDLATMTQDAAGTTPVTAAAQPIGRITDLTGNGLHATQSGANARPLLRADGEAWYADFDGVDDALSIDVNLYTFASVTIALAMRVDTSSGFQSIAGQTNGGAPDPIDIQFLASNVITFATGTGNSAAAMSDATDFVVIVAHNKTAGTCRFDGVLDVGGTTGGFASAPPPASQLLLFNRADSATGLDGRLYGAVIVDGTLSDSDTALVESWLASVAGVTL